MQFINFSRLLVLSASTRSLYERKLQKLLDIGATQLLVPEAVPAEISIHHNGTADPDLYSDKEEGKKNKTTVVKHLTMKSWIEKHMKLCCLSLKHQSSGQTHTTVRCEIHTSSVLLIVLLI